MLTHDATECPLSNDAPPPPPADDDEDPDYNPEAPEPNPTDNSQAIGEQDVDNGKEDDTHASSKKRKVEPSPSPEHINAFPMVYSEMRQVFATEDTHHAVSKRQRRESAMLEIRNWFMAHSTTPGQSSSNTGRSTSTTPNTNREGTVGQKPPEVP